MVIHAKMNIRQLRLGGHLLFIIRGAVDRLFQNHRACTPTPHPLLGIRTFTVPRLLVQRTRCRCIPLVLASSSSFFGTVSRTVLRAVAGNYNDRGICSLKGWRTSIFQQTTEIVCCSLRIDLIGLLNDD